MCPERGVHAVPAPWARPGSSVHVPVRDHSRRIDEILADRGNVARQLDEYAMRLWRFIRHYIDEARRYKRYTSMETIGLDEANRRGRRYLTVIADPTEHNMICAIPGKNPTTIQQFTRDFMDHNGKPGPGVFRQIEVDVFGG